MESVWSSCGNPHFEGHIWLRIENNTLFFKNSHLVIDVLRPWRYYGDTLDLKRSVHFLMLADITLH